MKACESVELRLLYLESTRQHGQTHDFTGQKSRVGARKASVQHICNTADYSYIREDLLCELVRANCNPNSPGIELTDDTIAVLEWRYPKAKKREITRHLAVQESPFEITFRVEDWEKPVRAMVQQVLLEKNKPRQRAVSMIPETRRSRDEAKRAAKLRRTYSDHGFYADCGTNPPYDSPGPSRKSSTSSASVGHRDPATTPRDVACTSPWPFWDDGRGEDSDGSATTLDAPGCSQEKQIDTLVNDCDGPMETESGCEWETDDVGEMDWAGIQIESADVPQKDIFWDWSPKEGRWYHKDPDGEIRSWFPQTIESS